jgi:hypothetical protein
MALVNAGNGGTSLYIANQSGWVHATALGTADVLIQAGVTCAVGATDPLYENAPQLFTLLQVMQGVPAGPT